MSGVYLGAGRACRYSGPRRGKGSIRGHWGLLGGVGGLFGGTRKCRGVRDALEAGRECRYSGARRGIGGIRGHYGLLGVLGTGRGCQGCIGELVGSVGTQGLEEV